MRVSSRARDILGTLWYQRLGLCECLTFSSKAMQRLFAVEHCAHQGLLN